MSDNEDQKRAMELLNQISRSTIAIVDTITQRGGFRGEELSTIGNLRDQCTQGVQIVEAWKPDTDFKIKIEKSDLQETETLIINSNKANKLLNWSPKYEIKDIAEKIVSWEKSAFKGKNITRDQIIDFYS